MRAFFVSQNDYKNIIHTRFASYENDMWN